MNQITIPYDAKSETELIACILIEPDIANSVLNRLSPDSFYHKPNRNIITAMGNLINHNEIIAPITVFNELKKLKLANESTEAYLFSLVEAVPTAANIDGYIAVIEEKTLLRELYYTAQKIQTDVTKGELSFSEIGETAESEMLRIIEMKRTSEIKKVHRFTDNVIEIIEKNKDSDGTLSGLDTGFDQLNDLTFGLQPEELIILAARPGVGKSTLALNIASNVCKNQGASVAFFSLEMGVDQLTMRLLSDSSGINLQKLRKGDLTSSDMAALLVAKNEIDKMNLYLDDSSNTDIGEIRTKCLKLKRDNALDLIVVDYLQLVNVSRFKGGRVEEVGKISRALKNMARELKVPVLALSQLSRQADAKEGDTEAKPRLSHLRESGSIEQDADIVIFLHRDRSKKIEGVKQKSHKVELIVAKNRQGQTDSFDLMFVGSQSKFTSMSDRKVDSQD